MRKLILLQLFLLGSVLLSARWDDRAEEIRLVVQERQQRERQRQEDELQQLRAWLAARQQIIIARVAAMADDIIVHDRNIDNNSTIGRRRTAAEALLDGNVEEYDRARDRYNRGINRVPVDY